MRRQEVENRTPEERAEARRKFQERVAEASKHICNGVGNCMQLVPLTPDYPLAAFDCGGEDGGAGA